jgi:flavin-dependent dehydrogenase
MLASIDVLIFGAGPAGLATAIFLRQAGLHVLLLDRFDVRGSALGEKIGESLSPKATPVLRQLGVWEAFAGGGHLPYYGNKVIWAQTVPEYQYFLSDPTNQGEHGWHLNRRLFEQQLAMRASEVGAEFRLLERDSKLVVHPPSASGSAASHSTPFLSHQFLSHQWRIYIDAAALSARFIVDATGRASWLARRQGANRLYEDRQIGVAAFLQTEGEPLHDPYSMIEAVEDGWWYSTRLPNNRLVLLRVMDAERPNRDLLCAQAGWWANLRQTEQSLHRVLDYDYRLIEAPKFVAADSGRSEPLCGASWLAVGDAAVGYDPLSTHGLTAALVGGRNAAAAINAYFSGDASALNTYAERVRRSADYFSKRRQAFYESQQRWPQADYWQRRHAASARSPELINI